MKVGIALPNNWGVMDPLDIVDVAVRAEELGFASVWASEHVINTAYIQSRIGKRPYYHPMAILSFVAARTTRVMLGTSIIILPFRSPFELAKYGATLDQLSRGRLIFGVGIGNIKDEFDAMRLPWEKRGLMTDEAMGVMKALWTQEDAEFHGKLFDFENVATSPKPYQSPHIPFWVGGMSDAAIRRAAVLGDGWHPTAISPDQLRMHHRDIRAMREAAGRDPDRFDICMRFNVTLEGQVLMEVERASTVPGDDMAETVHVARSFAEAGTTHFIFAINSNDRGELLRIVDKLGRDVLPHFND